MLDDILQFAAQTLVDNGRLSFWMPTANDQDQEIAVPSHPYMEVVAISTQVFNKCTPDQSHCHPYLPSISLPLGSFKEIGGPSRPTPIGKC